MLQPEAFFLESPAFFVRGSKGLRKTLESVTRKTAGQLEYVGEWHTHPDGYGVAASGDDRELLERLSQVMAEWVTRGDANCG